VVVGPSVLDPLVELARASRAAARPSRRRVSAAVVVLAFIVALLIARSGTGRARVAAVGVMLASALFAVGWSVLERRRMREPARILQSLAMRVDRERSERALRALSLIGGEGTPRDAGTSPDLARLHVARALALLPTDRIVERAIQAASRARSAALVVGIVALGIGLANAWALAEGADVLLARSGVAPLPMRWLGEAQVVARPPDYLHEPEVHGVELSPLGLPYGTTVTVRGTPIRAARRLLLSDGSTEVPFVEDGTGGVVARWPLAQSTSLHVVARFGGVVIAEPEALVLRSIPDDPPSVVLEGAPRQVNLVDEGDDDIPVRYVASDDHGLREVHLVLRSGTREERRVLARLDGETRSESGGRLLKLRDPFLKKSHALVEVTVEAKDNDPLTGPKWGKSATITLIPAAVGEPEARRLEALRRLRDALVDSLAWRLTHDVPRDAAGRSEVAAQDKQRAAVDDTRLQAAFTETYAGVRVPSRLRGLAIAQQQKTRKAIEAEVRTPSATTHTEVVRATERYVLVVDAIIRGLGIRDSRDAARELADVADDLASGATQLQEEAVDAKSRGAVRMDAATTVLRGGEGSLVRLGALGRDLGEIVDADLARVARARAAVDPVHAELAARDLAARLREPDPSFGARGSGGRAGGESGGARGTPGEDQDDSGDEVDQAEQAAAQDLERLAQDHAGEIGKMEQALAGATSEDELKAMREEARKHAQAVRDAARDLPSVGMGSDSWTSKGAAARELAEQMARSLEQAHADDAVQSGRSALGALDEAKKMLMRGAASWFDDPNGVKQRGVEEARRKLDAEEKWAEEKLEEMRQRAAARARSQLGQGGEEEEKLAERAQDLEHKAREQGSLPQQAIESVDHAERAARQAAQALRQGDADKGLQHQREAQRDLEAAREQLEGDEDESRGASHEGNEARGQPLGRVDIPKAMEHKGPEEFRRRVVRGLGQPASGALKDAVHRYAEGLLR
jgi:hypothetical protein